MSDNKKKSKKPKRPTLALGIDIGGSGIKGAVVDLIKGELVTERVRFTTPQPATPQAVGAVVKELVNELNVAHEVPVGIVLPSLVRAGIVQTAANIDDSWVGLHVTDFFTELLGHPVVVANDADGAGYAEAIYGKGLNNEGVTFFATLGTGIGTALIVNGTLVPNTELGHLEIDGYKAESRAASSAKDREGLTWQQWAARVQRYFEVVEFLFSPDKIIIGGGISKDHEHFIPLLNLHAKVRPATLFNHAGIIGAAALAGNGTSLSKVLSFKK